VSFDPEDLPSTLSLRNEVQDRGKSLSFDPEVSGPKGRVNPEGEIGGEVIMITQNHQIVK